MLLQKGLGLSRLRFRQTRGYLFDFEGVENEGHHLFNNIFVSFGEILQRLKLTLFRTMREELVDRYLEAMLKHVQRGIAATGDGSGGNELWQNIHRRFYTPISIPLFRKMTMKSRSTVKRWTWFDRLRFVSTPAHLVAQWLHRFHSGELLASPTCEKESKTLAPIRHRPILRENLTVALLMNRIHQHQQVDYRNPQYASCGLFE